MAVFCGARFAAKAQHTFEVSIRVPMLAYAPGLIKPGTKIAPMVQNIDLAPTILEAACRRLVL